MPGFRIKDSRQYTDIIACCLCLNVIFYASGVFNSGHNTFLMDWWKILHFFKILSYTILGVINFGLYRILWVPFSFGSVRSGQKNKRFLSFPVGRYATEITKRKQFLWKLPQSRYGLHEETITDAAAPEGAVLLCADILPTWKFWQGADTASHRADVPHCVQKRVYMPNKTGGRFWYQIHSCIFTERYG